MSSWTTTKWSIPAWLSTSGLTVCSTVNRRPALVAHDDLAAPDLGRRQPPPAPRVEGVGRPPRVEHLRRRSQDRLLVVAGQLEERPVDPLDAAVAVGDEDGVGRRVHRGALQLEPALEALAHRDVVVDGEDPDLLVAAADGVAEDAHVDRRAVAAGAHGLQRHQLTPHHLARDPVRLLGRGVGHDQRVDRPAANLSAGISEDAQKGVIGLDHAVFVVEQDDAFRRALEELAEEDVVEGRRVVAGGRRRHRPLGADGLRHRASPRS